MEERGGKTIICSVFFLDIVEYSKKSVAGQISQKERFNAFLSNAIRDVPVNDRIILDTGDGAAISFLGDVEDALRAALRMRKSLLSEEGLIDPPLLVRMGVNLGPVRLVKDINGQPNIVGDGVNVAQRVMCFAAAGQILVSRSYFEAASRLSQEYSGLFQYSGSRTDKHVREHEVYEIGHFGDMSGVQQTSHLSWGVRFSKKLSQLFTKSKGYWNALLTWSNSQATHLLERYGQASFQLKAAYIGMAILPLLLAGLLIVKLSHKAEVSHEAISKVATASSVVSDKVAQSAVVPALQITPTSSESAATNQKKPVQSAHKLKIAAEKKALVPKKEAVGIVLFKIKPWGDVYLDGTMIDACPPLIKLKVPAGAHVIEIRNTTFPVYKQTIKIKAGEKISISHKFGN